MTLLLLVVAFAGGATLLYLSHRHQGWLARPLSAPWARFGALLLLASLLAGCTLYPLNTTICAFLVGLMLVWGLLPFVPLLRKKTGGKH